MAQVKAIVLRAAGINCDVETQFALKQAGAQAERIHVNGIIKNKAILDDYQIMVFPGGFSYGDDVAAGKILANQIVHHLHDQVRHFVDQGKLVLGICNGFQVLVKTGILPGIVAEEGGVTITGNDSNKFEDRWVYLAPHSDHCVFIEKGQQIYLPIAHAEGKVVVKDDTMIEQLRHQGHIAYKYVDQQGEEGPYPVNPNGSIESIAGLTDSTGRVLGLMPHPERFIHVTHHPRWSRLPGDSPCDGMTIFHNAVAYVKAKF